MFSRSGSLFLLGLWGQCPITNLLPIAAVAVRARTILESHVPQTLLIHSLSSILDPLPAGLL